MRTIKSSRDIDSLFKTGRRASTGSLIVLVGPTPEGRGREGRVAFIAGKRLGNAVKRNRIKRVLRAAVRRLGVSWPGHDVAIIARPEVAEAAPGLLDQDLRAALRKVGICDA